MKTPIQEALRSLDRAPAVLTQNERIRLALVPAAVVAVVVALAVVQGEGASMAYASWTPTPSEPSEEDLVVAEAVCGDKVRDDDTIDSDQAEVTLAERRGDIVALVSHREAGPHGRLPDSQCARCHRG